MIKPELASRLLRFAEGKGTIGGGLDNNSKESTFVRHIFTNMGRSIAKAERFVLSPECGLTVHQMTKSMRMDKLLIDNRNYLRTPYDTLWVELAFTEEIRKLRTGNRLSGEEVAHLGMLISSKGRMYHLTTAWLHSNGRLGFSYYSSIFNLNDEAPATLLPQQQLSYDHALKTTDMSPEIAKEVFSRMLWIPNIQVISAMIEVGKLSREETVRKFHQADVHAKENGINLFIESVEDNPTLFGGWLLTLNAKTGTTKTEGVDEHVQKTPSFGTRKKNKVHRTNHKYTLITMTDYETADGTIRNEYQNVKHKSHFVRGHFKNRSTGMFWWNPFLRGSKNDLQQREAYVCQ